KVLEALAMQLPVIASPVSVDGIAVEHDVHALVSDVDNMAAGIVVLLNDAEKRRAIAKAGRHLIETYYSWSGVAEQYLALYKTL
ncbi:MAG: glycosyltransferase, partial [Aggregatilineales bacterium]